jgi:hypothetical protein
MLAKSYRAKQTVDREAFERLSQGVTTLLVAGLQLARGQGDEARRLLSEAAHDPVEFDFRLTWITCGYLMRTDEPD